MVSGIAALLVLGGMVQADPLEARVEATLARMTLDEKIGMIGGVDGFYVQGVPRLNIPRLKMSDGPVGVRNYGPTVAYPATLSLAASFNPGLAERFGAAIAKDARQRGVHIWLAPGVNLARVPQNGRNFEYLGEDPLVAGKIASGIIRGVQGGGVVATIKHFAGNEHENDRNNDSSEIDERTLRELYLKPFERAMKEAHPWAVMSSYNLLNGTHTSEHPWLVDQVLKKEWGFPGVYMSDWGAAHSTVGTFKHGLDLEMPGPEFMNANALKPLLASGELSTATLDDKVRRILRMTYAMEFDKRPQEVAPTPDLANEETAKEGAREGTVLLQNRKGTLPLDRAKVRRILVIGPNADPAVTGGGGSSFTTPTHSTSLFQALKELGGSSIQVRHMAGVPDLSGAFRNTDLFLPDKPTSKGVQAEYFDNPKLEGTPKLTREDTRVDFRWNRRPPAADFPRLNFSVRWTGLYRPAKSGDHMIVARSDDGIRVSIDGKRVLDSWNDRGVETDTAPVSLEAGRTYRVVVEYYQNAGDAEVGFGIVPGGWSLERDVPAADVRAADAVVLSTGLNNRLEGEGFDREFALPAPQQALLRYVLALNPRTIIVNNSGGPVDLAPFAPKAGAILQAWYPGMNGNEAIAELLYGVQNPSGHLPLSWPRDLKGTYYADAYPSKDRKMVYREGLFMGYRWFDANKSAPLFPFGHGLSYTTFSLSKPTASVSPETVSVKLTVKNTGKRAGAETVQVYSGRAKSAVPRPVRELRAFQRVPLGPGESREVTLTFDRADLAYYDAAGKRWVQEPGATDLWIGTSSRNLPHKVTVNL